MLVDLASKISAPEPRMGSVAAPRRQFKSFDAAKAWLRERGITSLPAMLKLSKEGRLPPDIPRSPKHAYKLYWKGCGDFFSTGKAQRHKHALRSYQDSVEFLAGLQISSREEFLKLKDEGVVPADIPTAPNTVYRTDWRGWGTFLGSGTVAAALRKFRPYTEAKAWVQQQGLAARLAYRKFSSDGHLPLDIPAHPYDIYKDEWEGWPTYLGYVTRRGNCTPFLEYSEASAWAREHKVLTSLDWLRRADAVDFPKNLPVAPQEYYKKEWKGWSAFLGNKRKNGTSVVERILAAELSHFLPVDASIQTVSLGGKKKKRPDIVVPTKNLIIEYDGSAWHKDSVCRDIEQTNLLSLQGWTVVRVRESPLEPLFANDVRVNRNASYFDVVSVVLRHIASLGLLDDTQISEVDEYIASRRLRASESDICSTANWRPFSEAREFARSLGISSDAKWRAHWKRPENTRPRDVPSNPRRVYALEWVSDTDFYQSPVRGSLPPKSRAALAQSTGFGFKELNVD